MCLENAIFLPDFPIDRMSLAELQRASSIPHRWIALSTSQKRDSNGNLPSRSRSLTLPIGELTSIKGVDLIPGGQYLVVYLTGKVAVCDLGNVLCATVLSPISESPPPRTFLADVATSEYCDLNVHPTPDGLGLRILTTLIRTLSIFEIYPQSENPKLTKIVDLVLAPTTATTQFPAKFFQFGNRVLKVYYESLKFTFIFRVWDFAENASACWSTTGSTYYSGFLPEVRFLKPSSFMAHTLFHESQFI